MDCLICKKECNEIIVSNAEEKINIFAIHKDCIKKELQKILPLLISLQGLPKMFGIDTSKINEFLEWLKKLDLL